MKKIASYVECNVCGFFSKLTEPTNDNEILGGCPHCGTTLKIVTIEE